MVGNFLVLAIYIFIHKLAAYNYVYSNNENWHCKLVAEMYAM